MAKTLCSQCRVPEFNPWSGNMLQLRVWMLQLKIPHATTKTWCSQSVKVLVTQSCPTLCDPMDCSPPGSSVHRILHARILERVAISFSRGSSQCRDWTWVSHIVGRLFTDWATREYIVAYYGRYYGILWQPRLVKQPLSWSLCLTCPYLPWYLNYNALLLKDCEWLPFVF